MRRLNLIFKNIQNFLDRCHNVISAVLLLARVASVKRRKEIGIRVRETAQGTRGGGKGQVPYFPLMARPLRSRTPKFPFSFPFLTPGRQAILFLILFKLRIS